MNKDESPLVYKWRKLTNLLSSATERRKITWNETSEDNSYITTINQFPLVFKLVGHDYFVEIYDKDKEVAEKFSDTDLEDSPDHYYMVLTELHNNIRRSITGADKILDSIIDTLDDEILF